MKRAAVNVRQKSGTAVLAGVAAFALGLHNLFGGYETTVVLYTKSEFLNRFREAFPEYSDVQDSKLYSALREKHPNFRTWIVEEAGGSPVRAVSIKGLPTNYRLPPPPAYEGAEPETRSRKAFVSWLDEPTEVLGVLLPVVMLGVLWFLMFRDNRQQDG